MPLDELSTALPEQAPLASGTIEGLPPEALPADGGGITDINIDVAPDDTVGQGQAASMPVERPALPSPVAVNYDDENGRYKDDDASFGDYVIDFFRGIGNGAAQAGAETAELAHNLIPGTEEVDYNGSEVFGKNTTGLGTFTRNATAFLVDFIGFGIAGKALKGVKLARGLFKGGKAAKWGRSAAQGFAAEAASMDGMEDGIIDMLTQNPAVGDFVQDAAAKSKDKSDFEGRLLHGFEGVFVGEAVNFAFAKIFGKFFSKGRVEIGELSPADRRELAQELSEIPGLEDDLLRRAHPTEFDDAILPVSGQQAIEPKPGEFGLPDNGFLEQAGQTTSARTGVSRETGEGILNDLRKTLESSTTKEEAFENISADYNLSTRIIRDEDPLKILNEVHDRMEPATLQARTGTEHFEQAAAEGAERLREFGMENPAELIAAAASGRLPLREVKQTIDFLKDSTEYLTGYLGNMAKRSGINDYELTTQELYDVFRAKSLLDAVYVAERNLGTETGRALSYFRHTGKVHEDSWLKEVYTAPLGLTPDGMAAEMAKQGFNAKRAKAFLREMDLNEGNLPAQARAARKFTNEPTKLGMLNEFRINNMLSGPFTMTANLIGNVLKSLSMPTEKYLAGAITGNAAMRQEAMDTFAGLITFWRDSWTLARKAFKVGDNIIDQAGSKMEVNGAQITEENIRKLMLKGEERELSPVESNIASAMGFLGPYLRIPSRIMVSTDEFFKQLNFRADYAAKLMRAEREKGTVNPWVLSERVRSGMDGIIDPATGNIKTEALKDADSVARQSLEYARQSTWTQDLGKDTIGGVMQNAAYQMPALRFIVPFIKTPVNIFRDFVTHIPGVANFTRQYKEAIAKGGEEAALAHSKLAFGTGTISLAVMLAATGQITGSPPKDPRQRNALEATGWKPYSIKVGDRYISYRRLDPIGMFFGICADLNVAGHYLTQGQFEDAFKTSCAALCNNITSKTYMQGIAEFMDLAMNPEMTAKKYFAKNATTFIPFASGLRFARGLTDDSMRDTRDFMDYLLNSVPGFSDSVPARRNWVTGEVLTSDLLPRQKHDMVLDEMDKMSTSVQGAPSRSIHGIDLNGTQYSRFLELHGTTKIQGKTLYEALGDLFQSEGYDINRTLLGDPPDKENGPRAVAIRRLVYAYRQQAIDDLLMEDRELNNAVHAADYQRVMSKSGRMTAENQQDMLNNLLQYR